MNTDYVMEKLAINLSKEKILVALKNRLVAAKKVAPNLDDEELAHIVLDKSTGQLESMMNMSKKQQEKALLGQYAVKRDRTNPSTNAKKELFKELKYLDKKQVIENNYQRAKTNEEVLGELIRKHPHGDGYVFREDKTNYVAEVLKKYFKDPINKDKKMYAEYKTGGLSHLKSN